MLKARNLDDQSFAEIVAAAESRLPWLCPEWTDHNSTDPGITILELMAWYKELQQYRMNHVTDTMKLKLLKLAGARPRAASPAACAVEIAPDAPERMRGERLYTAQGVPFELRSAVAGNRPVIAEIRVCADRRHIDVGGMLGERPITFQPFSLGGEKARLRIGFSRAGKGDVWLWFDVEAPAGVRRNPFADDTQMPRTIRWECEGASETRLLRDETYALSVSGYVQISYSGDWKAGEDGLYWLTLALEDPGCEESVRLRAVSAERFMAVQQETWAQTRLFCAEGSAGWYARLDCAMEKNAALAVFLRTADGWEQVDGWQTETREDCRQVYLDTSKAAQDGADNVMIVCLDKARAGGLLLDARGLPGETLYVRLEGLTVLTDDFSLLCNTLCRDGKVRPALWRCVDDLHPYGPRDRVFTYDQARQTVTFGNGEHGALLQGGLGAVMAADLRVSCCALGNVPAGRNLSFSDGIPLKNTAASGGRPRETVNELQARLISRLNVTKKCVSASDYERLARETPGLRVAAVKAIAAYDPDEPTGVSREPVVTVVVVPDSSEKRPMPDGRFLSAVQSCLDGRRPIGTRVKVVAPVYVDIDVSLSIRGRAVGGEDGIRLALDEFFAGGKIGIGGTLRIGDLGGVVEAVPGVSQCQAQASTASPGCDKSVAGDIRLPKRGIARLGNLYVEQLR